MAASSKATRKGPRPKHVPVRTCIACRQPQAKRQLVRVVRAVTGQVQVDLTGKKAGRGAYLCRARACWELAFRKKALEHALQTQVSPEDRAEIEKFMEGLC